MRWWRHVWLTRVLLIIIWFVFLRSAWPAADLFHSIPKGPDTLEVLWALQWYREALGKGQSPFFYPLAFAPMGWHTANLAHTPFLIGLMLPWAILGGEAFAFNIFGWIAMTLAFGGAYRLSLRRSRDPWIAAAAGMVYALLNTAYAGLREFGGHLHIMAGLALIPWLVLELEYCHAQGWKGSAWWRAGALWGIAGSMHLQMLVIGGIPVLIYVVRKDGLWKSMRALILIGIVALAIAGPWLALFRWSFVEDQMQPHTLDLLAGTGYDWGFAFQWNPYSPLRNLIGPASGLPRFPPIGLLPWLIGGPVCVWSLARKRGPFASGRLLVAAGIGGLLATGVMLTWKGPIIFQWPAWLESIYQKLWRWGYLVNPDFLGASRIPPEYLNRLYSPLLLLGLLIPVLPYAAASARFVGLFVLGSVTAISEALTRVLSCRLVRLAIGLAWMLELFSVAPTGWRWPSPLHPAYVWLDVQAKEGMALELGSDDKVLRSSSTLVSTLYHRKPVVNGWGSFYPRWFVQLDQLVTGSLDRAQRLSALGVRYLILHGRPEGSALLSTIRDSPIRCFDPPRIESLWDEAICIVELQNHPLTRITNLFLVEGWSGAEDWGIWADSLFAKALWLTRRPSEFELEIRAFPLCPADTPQHMSIYVNDRLLATVLFQDCDEKQWAFVIPANLIREGWNALDLRFAYVRSPAEASGGKNPDPRSLAVGFRTLRVREKHSK